VPEKRIKGVPASGGIAIGPTFYYAKQRRQAERRSIQDPGGEVKRLERAVEQAKAELEAIQVEAEERAGAQEAAIFGAHVMMLEDPELLDRVKQAIQEEKINADYAWQQGVNEFVTTLQAIEDEYLAGRAADLKDVGQRVLRILQGAEAGEARLDQPSIILAEELAPSDTVTLEKAKVLAFCTERGGPTSHVAILSKALGIPAVVGFQASAGEVPDGTNAILDGNTGTIILNPEAETASTYQDKRGKLGELESEALSAANEPAVTRDGVQIEVAVNIGSLNEVEEGLKYGAEGIGLLRTEFLFLGKQRAPSEESQYEAYREILQVMGERPVVARTLDIGGDKPASYLGTGEESNPFLGVRGLRLSLKHGEIFETQLRALLRAGEGHNLKIMFPMVATLEELLRAREHLERARKALESQGRLYARDLEVGVMIEVPSAAIIADRLAGQVDFFSIGTNDLTQYTLAADRTNPELAPIADDFHPAVLRLMRTVVEAGHAQGCWVGICGELAGNSLVTPVLLGIGLDELSMNPRSIPLVKQVIRNFNWQDAREIADQALGFSTAVEVREYLERYVQ
jgi:phosphoenolpyruvate-protein phosphotransferase (PTS system enzyme I)